MDREARARLIAARNTAAAAARRRKAHDAAPSARRTLLLDAARLDDLAAQWRAVAAEEAEKAAAPRVPAPRRRCAYCPKAAGANGYECAEHDEEPPAVSCAPSRPLTPGGVR